jgi:putative acetyltransferase
MLTIRPFVKDDAPTLRALVFNTVRQVNIADYSAQQVTAWAPKCYDAKAWLKRMQATHPFVAVQNNQIVGFADIQKTGYIDFFYCHWQFQRQGIGSALMQTLLSMAKQQHIQKLRSHVSITAKPFFEHFGFKVESTQQIKIEQQVLPNFIMTKVVA